MNLCKSSTRLSFIMWWWVLCVTLAVSEGGVPTLANGSYNVVCYYASWAHYRQGEAGYTVQDVPVENCTHVIYTFALLNKTSLTLVPGDSYLDIDLDNYRNFLQLRHRNPQVKLLLGLGGLKDSRNDKYSQLVSEPRHRATFIDQVLDFFTTYDFDGLHLDWQYPNYEGFKHWVQELHAAFEPRRLLLTASVSAIKSVIDRGYNVEVMQNALDQVHLITYDMYGSWESRVANHAPLFPAPDNDNQLSVDFAVQYWLSKGVPASKLVVGVPSFGRSFTLVGDDARVGAKASGAGVAGTLLKQKGVLAYYEVCQAQLDGWKKVVEADGPHLTNGDQWVGYDDIATVTKKAEYVRQKNLGGVMMWEVSMDDFNGSCGAGVNPLISAIAHALRGSDNMTNGDLHPLPSKPPVQETPIFYNNELKTSPRPATNTPPPKPSIIIPEVDMVECRRKGYTRDTASCILFFKCVGNKLYHLSCRHGFHWNQEHTTCEWPRLGHCTVLVQSQSKYVGTLLAGMKEVETKV